MSDWLRLMRINRVVLAVLLCLGLSVPAQADDGRFTRDLLHNMSEAIKKLNYEGTFVFTRGDRMDAVHILHKYDSGGEREKIISLTGYAREIIRNNQTVTCIFPDTEEVMVEKTRAESFTSRLPGAVDAIADYYDFSLIGEERIAGRNTWVVRISPRDIFRYGYQLWIDQDASLLLKSELRDNAGTPIERLMFTQIELHEFMDDELFAPSITGEGFTWYQYVQDTNRSGEHAAQRWQVTWMPDGFRLSDYDVEGVSAQGGTVDHMIFSDGVATVSIFIEKPDENDPEDTGPANIGGVNVYVKIKDGYQFTAVGEVPQDTVKRMVDSVVASR